MGSGQSTLQVSEEGFHYLAESLGSSSSSTSTAAAATTTTTLASIGTVVSNSTTSSTSGSNEINNVEILSNHYKVENGLYPGSGRMMRTYRIVQHNTSENNNSSNANAKVIIDDSHNKNNSNSPSQQQYSQSAAVVKTGWILCKQQQQQQQQVTSGDTNTALSEHERILQEHVKELQRIKDICQQNQETMTHIAPFLKWFCGNEIRIYPRSTIITTTTPTIGGQPTIVKPIYLVRPYIYTTLADRLVSRPWLHICEKLWITYQLLYAIQQIHDAGIVHGFLTTENIGLTSTGWVVLLDVASYKIPTRLLPDNDPSEYLYYFQPQSHQEHHHHGMTTTTNNTPSTISSVPSSTTVTPPPSIGVPSSSNSSTIGMNTAATDTSSSVAAATATSTTKTSSEKRCYLAPERFYTPSSSGQQQQSLSSTKDASASGSSQPTATSSMTTAKLTPAMDIFSLGCVIIELFLNGERCLDLGELMEYRRLRQATTSLQQKLNKIESSAVRAACKHMLSVDPNQRLSASQYLERLHVADQFASSFHILTETIQRVNVPCNTLRTQQLRSTLAEVSNDNNNTDDTTSSIGNKINKTMINDNNDNRTEITDTAIIPSSSLSVPPACPDARIAIAASAYGQVLWECMGIRDKVGEIYFSNILGQTMLIDETTMTTGTSTKKKKTKNIVENKQIIDTATSDAENSKIKEEEKKEDIDDLFLQVEEMLKDLESLDLIGDDVNAVITKMSKLSLDVNQKASPTSTTNNDKTKKFKEEETAVEEGKATIERSALCKSSILIYLQLILSTVRYVQRPSSKLVALQLIDRISKHCGDNDEARLQRIVPVTISLLEDQDPLVRAFAVRVLTNTLSIIQTFPPSDAKVFPQYIFKRVAHMISDPSLIVRLAFTRCIAVLAETAHRFLDITHAVRLYEAVGNNNGGTNTASNPSARDGVDPVIDSAVTRNIFGDHVAKLLDPESRSSSRMSFTTEPGGPNCNNADSESVRSESAASLSKVATVGKTLIINNSYSAELAGLHESVSRWVVHLTTDQSEHSSLQKRAILSDLGRLCAFFGLEGVMSFILPQILAFLNERKDWELRVALFEHLPSVCHIIGRAATEEFVLPCVEIGLVDSEERVICSALSCLSRMVEFGLISRSAILGLDSTTSIDGKINERSFLRKYGILLLFPAEDIRLKAIETYVAVCRAIGSPDRDVHIIPQLRPFFRFQPQSYNLLSSEGMQRCLNPPWPKSKYKALMKALIQLDKRDSSIPGVWTSIGVFVSDDKDQSIEAIERDKVDEMKREEAGKRDPQLEYFQEYLKMLVKHTAQNTEKCTTGLSNGIEGPVKLAQSIMFPRQNGPFQKSSLPEWYSSLRDKAESCRSVVSEASTIKSISTLGHVYGLSIMGPVEGITENIVDAADGAQTGVENEEVALQSSESKKIEAAFRGEWGSETTLDPDIVDTCLLIPKLKALGVPPLPPHLGSAGSPVRRLAPGMKDIPFGVESKPRIKGLVATSLPNSGHTAPVVRLAMSKDQYFFVSGSHDGTCRVWEIPQIDDSVGVLDSSISYAEHSKFRPVRINDLAMLEGTHSIASGASDGSVHVWRVDMVHSEHQTMATEQRLRRDRSRVVGTSTVRKVESAEGEILCVSHFNSAAASVVTYASQKGVIHSWDLRCAKEPFTLHHSPDLGYLSSMALGSDRHWMVTGTNKGYLTLWDIRFQQPVKLWLHSRRSPITRLATSCVLPPQTWTMPTAASGGPRPYIFIASGSNECSMFDAITGSCTECFRSVILGGGQTMNASVEDPPQMIDTPMHSRPPLNNMVKALKQQLASSHLAPVSSINCMVGSIGANSNSYLVTGGSDCAIRFWDFWSPSKCYVISGRRSELQARPSFERVDFDSKRRLMVCRESGLTTLPDSSKLLPRKMSHGLRKEDHHHSDSVQDIKIINNTVVSCSRDCTVKVWR